jgi:hypothetical protein
MPGGNGGTDFDGLAVGDRLGVFDHDDGVGPDGQRLTGVERGGGAFGFGFGFV